jgi:hypothetical protein
VKVYKIQGQDEQKTGWFFDWYEQWSGLFKQGNWVDFTVIFLKGEYAPYKNCLEIEAGLLGLEITVTYVYKPILEDDSQ